MTTNKANYTAFASFLSDHADTFAVKRFRELQIRNILLYQAELAHLEAELAEIDLEDGNAHPDIIDRLNFRWQPPVPCSGSGSGSFTSDERSKYQEKMLQIRSTLAAYNDAVEQYKRLCAIAQPSKIDMTFIHDWLNHSKRGQYFLAGDVEDVWTVESGDGRTSKAAEPDDFYGFEEQSGLALHISSIVLWIYMLLPSRERFAWLSKCIPARKADNANWDGVHHIDTTSYGLLDQTVTTVVASMLPILPIIAFYFVESTLKRIGMILAFTAAFTVIMVVGLKIKPHATLAITTAMAAVQVVYVGSTAGGNN